MNEGKLCVKYRYIASIDPEFRISSHANFALLQSEHPMVKFIKETTILAIFFAKAKPATG